MNNFTVPFLFMPIKLSSSYNFFGDKGKEGNQGYRYRIEPIDFTKRALTDTAFQNDKDEFIFLVHWQ